MNGRGRTGVWLTTLALASLLSVTGAAGSSWAIGASQPEQAGMQELSLRVDGLSCPFCAYGLEKKLTAVEHVASLDIQLDGGRAVIRPEPGTSVDLAAMERAVEQAGFTARRVTLKARGTLTELDGVPALSLPGGTLLLLADDEQRQALLSQLGGTDTGTAVTVQGTVEFNHVPEGHAGHPFTLDLESFQE